MKRKEFYIKKQKRRKKITLIVCAILVLGIGVFAISKAFSSSDDKIVANAKSDDTQKENNAEQKPKVIGPNDIIPGDNIIKSAESYAVPANIVYKMIFSKEVVKQPKSVFLTFDDGPSENTDELLNILKNEGVHATFFVLGSQLENSDKNRERLKREIDEGNAIANHSYSHNYKILYPGNSVNPSKFMEEFNKTNKLMQDVLGTDFDSKVVRMPGGYISRKYYKDPHLKELDKDFKENNIVSIDWDAETGDATGRNYTVQQMVNNVSAYAKSEKHMVLLMHDAAAKKQTVKALPAIIKYLKGQGYEFKVISNAKPEDKNTTASNNESNSNASNPEQKATTAE
ncbi:MAG: polysaccharide deacetylase family protein [Clostridium sp.]